MGKFTLFSQVLVASYTGRTARPMTMLGWTLAIALLMPILTPTPEALGSEGSVHVPSVSFLSLEEQSTGQYYYTGYILLRKAGHTAIGVDGRRSRLICFRGFVEGDRIVNATRIMPPYQPDSRWESRDGTMVDLSGYDRVGQPDEEQLEALQKCLDVFAR